MNGKQYAALFYTSLISFCFIFRNTGADKCSSQSARSATHTDACQSGHNRSSGEERTYARYRNTTYSRQPAQYPPTTAPEPAPVAAPSGAFVAFS